MLARPRSETSKNAIKSSNFFLWFCWIQKKYFQKMKFCHFFMFRGVTTLSEEKFFCFLWRFRSFQLLRPNEHFALRIIEKLQIFQKLWSSNVGTLDFFGTQNSMVEIRILHGISLYRQFWLYRESHGRIPYFDHSDRFSKISHNFLNFSKFSIIRYSMVN